jgi:hypothetical protein
MNERIFQLAKQAQIKFEAHLQHLGIDTAVITPADLEKFTELIVRECAEIADNADATREKWQSIGKFVREHFGVK